MLRALGFSWFALYILTSAGVCLADATRDLQLAARVGDLKEVRRLIESGVPADASDAWGNTPLRLAAKGGDVKVVRYLLKQGADPNARETFFGTNVLFMALRHGAPDYQVAKILLSAGAKDRGSVLAHALDHTDVALARAAAASGSLPESEVTDLRNRFDSLEGELKEILANLETRPDPPPPEYSKEQLAEFVGSFESREGESADVEIHANALVLTIGGEQTTLAATADRVFRHGDTGVTARYYGRAGTIEGLTIERPDEPPIRLRLADATIEGGVNLPAPVLAPNYEPTVHWPGFRGANRSGIGDGIDTPVDFDLEAGKGVAWRVDIGGLSNSSPVVWGDRVYVTTVVAEGGSTPLRVGQTGSGEEVEENTDHRWLVLAYDKSDGQELWQTEIGRGVPLTRRHFKATQANSSPVTDGQHIVVVFPTAGLACLGTDGKRHWQHSLGGLNAGGFNDPALQWGFAASPIIHGGKVILQVDIHDGAYLAAWDLQSGKPLWRTRTTGHRAVVGHPGDLAHSSR